MSVVEWVREPLNRWVPCSCGRSGRWLLEVLGHPTGGAVCEGCRVEMQSAYDRHVPAGTNRSYAGATCWAGAEAMRPRCMFCGIELGIPSACVCEACVRKHWKPWDRPEWRA